MKVLKFGGSSVGNSGRIKNIVEIIKKSFDGNQKGVIIFSAYQGITDQLIETGRLAAAGNEEYKNYYELIHTRHIQTAKELLSIKRQSNILAELTYQLHQLEEILHGVYLVRELSPRTMDYVMSFGERLSAFTISECLRDGGFTNSFLDTRRIIRTDLHFGRARVDFSKTNKNILEYFKDRPEVQIATGFIASGDDKETTTLGRGGSDFSASIFGAALKVDEIEIWTDVNGVLTADPGKVKTAFSIEKLSYEEAMELSHFGAKVIYPPTMQPALDNNILLRIKNTLQPDFAGTVVCSGPSDNPYAVTGLSSIDKITLLTIQGSGMIGEVGIAERIFSALARGKINIILITQASSEHSICLAILPKNKKAAVSALRKELKYEIRDEIVDEIIVENNMSIIAVVGENMRRRRGLAGKVFRALGENDVNITAIAQGSSELNISIVVSAEDESKALNVIHEAFFNGGEKIAHLFLLGAGVVGGALLRILKDQTSSLLEKRRINLKVAGIANIESMLIERQGIDLKKWEKLLEKSSVKTNLPEFCDNVRQLNLKNSIFVDCTASDQTAVFYPQFLKAGIDVVTPNKKANTQDMESYRDLRRAASAGGVQFRYETNAGAGLPVIQTIHDLIAAGDRIHKIEGVLSGTLSYIFNEYKAADSFSSLVNKAREKGYTEPDPREDLSGMDAARKILILSRELGWELNLSDVDAENLTPKEAQRAKSVEAYFEILQKFDGDMRNRVAKAEKAGKKLRYIARAESGKLTAGLIAVAADHPFYNLQGSDNIIAIYSQYYPIPLVVRGAGAGAQVTAAGVLADILKTIKG